MPGFDTAKNILNDAALELGLITSALADPFTSTNPAIIKLRQVMKTCGRRLLKLHQWTHLEREHTFATVDGTASYALPTDFGRWIDGTFWNRTQRQPIPGSATPQQWQGLKAVSSTGIYKVHRMQGDLLYLYPTPTAAENVYGEYRSRYWGAAAFAKEVPTASSDVIQFDPDMFTRFIIFRWLARNGFASQDAFEEFKEAFALATSGDGTAPTLSLNGGASEKFLDDDNVPESDWS